jgi:hypothetical protein
MLVIKDEVAFSSLGRFRPSSLLSYQVEAPLAIASAFSHITFGLYLHITLAFTRGENLHPKVEASCNSLCYTKHMISHVFRTFGRGRPPTVAPRSINLFLCNKFKLRRERKPLAEGLKKHLPFARIANITDIQDPPNRGALGI